MKVRAVSEAILRLDKVTKRFPGVTALKDVDFALERGEILALCGENGAGKSTLIKVLSGIWPCGSYEGRLFIDGAEARFNGIPDSEKAGIAVIYQELALAPDMTVAENIFLGAEPLRYGCIDWNRVFSRTAELMAEYRLDIDPAAQVRDLGVGRQQLVEIVKALSKQSRILLLDEPTAALTEVEVDLLLRIVRQLKAKGISCIYISHKLDEVFRIADRITVLRDGASVATRRTSETDRDEVVRLMVGREITDFFPHHAATPGAIRLDVSGLSVRDKASGRLLLDNISFTVRAGEVLGLGGLMGAGRTELLMHLFAGSGVRCAGQVLLNGRELRDGTPTDAIRHGLMLVSEDRKRYGLILDQSIGFNLSLASLERFTRHGLINGNAEFKRNCELFEALGIRAPNQEYEVRRLSGGNQQKVVLGKALMTEPSVIFLDEPTRGIDVGAKVEVYKLMGRLTDAGNAVVMVSSELPELMAMSDRTIILSQGRIGGTFTAGEADQEAILRAAMAHHRQETEPALG